MTVTLAALAPAASPRVHPPAPGRTLAELARVMGCSPATTLTILEESAALGHVELVAGEWRITARAERLYGAAFRALPDRWQR